MSVETESAFSRAIQDHIDLKEKNSSIDDKLPIDPYSEEDPFENHPLFKSEEQARIEETMDGEDTAPATTTGPLSWPGEEAAEEGGAALDEALWGRSRDFDWGD